MARGKKGTSFKWTPGEVQKFLSRSPEEVKALRARNKKRFEEEQRIKKDREKLGKSVRGGSRSKPKFDRAVIGTGMGGGAGSGRMSIK